MLKLILAAVLIYISPIALASSYGSGADMENASASFELTSLNELLPDTEDLERQSRCEGNTRTRNSCSQFYTLDTCLDLGAEQGCFWASY